MWRLLLGRACHPPSSRGTGALGRRLIDQGVPGGIAGCLHLVPALPRQGLQLLCCSQGGPSLAAGSQWSRAFSCHQLQERPPEAHPLDWFDEQNTSQPSAAISTDISSSSSGAAATSSLVPDSTSNTTGSSSSSAQALETVSLELQQQLLVAGLQYNSVMAVVKLAVGTDTISNSPEVLVSRVQELMQLFGTTMTNKLLLQDPELLARLPATLARNWSEIKTALDLSEAEARQVLARAPLLMQHSCGAVLSRVRQLQVLLQADAAATRKLLIRCPNMMRTSMSRFAEVVPYLCEVTGLKPPQLIQIFTSWPMLPTTRLHTLQARHKSLQELLRATPSQLQRVCRHWPNLLARDHQQLSANLQQLSSRLGVDIEEMRAMVRHEPGLLNYNVATLTSKINEVTMTLRLPRKLALTLLTHNRALLTCSGNLKERLGVLQERLQVEEDQLYKLVHHYPSIMRFPPALIDAKLATLAALAATHPPWQQQWGQCTSLARLRYMQCSWSAIWRCVYLRATGQADTCASMLSVVTHTHARFQQAYPEFLAWLERYNKHTGGHALPAAGSLHANRGSESKANIYSPVVPMVMDGKKMHAGSLFRRHGKQPVQHGEQEQDSLQQDTAADLEQQPPAPQQQQQQVAKQQSVGVPATQAAMLACLLGTTEQHMQQVLTSLPAMKKITWRTWAVRLRAAEELLERVGLMTQQLDSTSSCSSNSSRSNSSSNSSNSSNSSSSSGVSSAVSSNGSTVGSDQQQQEVPWSQQVSAVNNGTDSSPHATTAGPGSTAADTSSTPRHLCAADDATNLLSAAEAAANDFMPGGKAPDAAIAAALTALNLAHFSSTIGALPTPAPPPVAQLVLLNPRAFCNRYFNQSCHTLHQILQQHPAAQQELQQAGLEGVAKLLGFPMPRAQYVEFLLQTGKLWPWPLAISPGRPCKQNQPSQQQTALQWVLTANKDARALLRPHYDEYTAWRQAQAAVDDTLLNDSV